MAESDQILSGGPKCRIPTSEVSWNFGPSGGPGGQHANRSNTRVEATLDLASAQGIEENVREVLVAKLGSVMRVTVDQHRSQFRNRESSFKPY
ncbi:MAG: peptide chain release factor-like protein [Acidimicrobiales bacterium]